MDDKTLYSLLAFGGTALILSRMQGRKLLPPPQPQGPSISSEESEDVNYLGGFLIGAASVGMAWWVWERRAKRAAHRYTEPTMY